MIHPDFVKSIIVLNSGHVITGCRDENIRVWDGAVLIVNKSDKCLAVITAHFGEISALGFSGNNVFSASHDSTFRQWKLSEMLTNVYTPVVEKVATSLLTEEEERELQELMEL